MFLSRYYENLNKFLKPNKVVAIFGSRQVGKTTLVNHFLKNTGLKYKIDFGDNIRIQQILGSQDFTQILNYAEGYELIVIDEAQKIPNIGMGLKILVDQIHGIRVIATGSSSFELAGQIGEPLTGRKRTLKLYPLSQFELIKHFNLAELKEKLDEFLIFGSYPAVLIAKTKKEKIKILEEITHSYLLKDILAFDKVKDSKILTDLLRLIAFQVGNEVSHNELATKLGIDYKTAGRYLDLLEKSFILFNLRGFSGNLRNEITKKSKYYFYDNGILNAVLSNFNNLELRDDIGKLWENFIVTERLKTQEYKGIFANNYFWRTWDQKEVDFIEERGGKLYAYEFKWQKGKSKKPKKFFESYKNVLFKVIDKENYPDFLL